MTVTVIGAGLAGCEAAYRAANRGCKVRLYEMKPLKFSPAHRSEKLCELVCSNSLRSDLLENAVGLLKEEMRRLSSLVIEAADETRVPAGGALAVDREKFSSYVTEKIRSHPNIELISGEITEIPKEGVVVIATGPLTSDALSDSIARLTGSQHLHFYDAAAPIVDASSINTSVAYLASRYGKGEAAYLNCPMSREEYDAFYTELINAKRAELHSFEKDPKVFEGCMPVEIMAQRGVDTLRYGPLKPVGLPDPRTGKEPYAVLQLRSENKENTMYNLVGFQTNLLFGEQKRVFGMIPGLENAEFLRYGVMHRDTYIDSPRLLDNRYSLRSDPRIFFAGQITGVEGYVESAASGIVAGENAASLALGEESFTLPDITVIGSMANYVSGSQSADFQPMNANFGLIAPPDRKIKGGKKARYAYYAERSLEYMESLSERNEK